MITAQTPRAPYNICYICQGLGAIEAWPADILADYARMVELVVEHGPDLGLPHSRALGSGLFELRPKGRSGIGRAFYGFLAGQRVIVLHAFIKKTQQTSDRDLKKARDRMKEVIQNEQAKVRAGRARP
ncbi:type II toxin-antitoxin system RelE/ParE family toxin [Acidiferrobacter sp.]|uniref:type II toxin-antitoxin system RelE/ParE family toxin n=1 Tax=Acidiferrobacter sp. TaxID=1872107 RepID=UPI00343A4447